MRISIELEENCEPEQISPLALAYIGDAVLELYVRTFLVNQGSFKVNALHKKAVKFVNAVTQASLLRKIEESLTMEELAIAKRGRNAKSGHVPKNAEVIDYRYSTGLETLIGFLFLKGRTDRIAEIFLVLRQIVEAIEIY
ncbi:ribonuclease III domain-containing protein [Bacillota bacterium LX-D]|nr:ribonuclease III domain-containing protein [Bacillota bacterium LX-D]